MCMLCNVDITHAYGSGHAVMDELKGMNSASGHDHGGLADRNADGEIIGDTLGIASNTGTSATISIGQTVNEVLETVGDRDWFKVTLSAGEQYEITLDGSNITGSGLGSLLDPFLRIYDANGTYVTFNDDGGPGYNSRLNFSANTSGTYFIEAASWDDRFTGEYALSIKETGGGGNGGASTMQDLADYLTTGFFSTPRHFNLGTTGTNAKNGVLTYTVSGYSEDGNGLSAARSDLVREAFKLYEEILGIDFRETTSATADFRFRDNDNGAWASTNYNVSGGTGYINYARINVASNWHGGTSDYDSYTFQTVLHEIGHALGLGHQGDYNGSASYSSNATFANDSWQASMMSYFSQSENTSINASFAYLLGPMIADLLALDDFYGQYGYGVDNAFSGSTVYGFGTNIASNVSDSWHKLSQYADNTSFTIVDSGGIDTVNFSGYNSNQRIDLRINDASMTQPYTSDIGFESANMVLAAGTIIENAWGGGGNDLITGNEYGNRLYGGNGNDSLYGGAANDVLYGGEGADTLDGGDAAYDMVDYVAATGGLILDMADSSKNAGPSATGDVLVDVERLAGSNFDDTLYGDNGANVLFGRSGNDTLDGRGGHDGLYGSDGDDRLIIRSDDLAAGGAGADIFEFHTGFLQMVTYFGIEEGDMVDISNLGLTKQEFLDTGLDVAGQHIRFHLGTYHKIQLNNVTLDDFGVDQILLG